MQLSFQVSWFSAILMKTDEYVALFALQCAGPAKWKLQKHRALSSKIYTFIVLNSLLSFSCNSDLT